PPTTHLLVRSNELAADNGYTSSSGRRYSRQQQRWGMHDTVPQRRLRTFSFLLVCWLLFVAVLAALGGCTRHFFRRAADREVNAVLDEKDRCVPAIDKIEQFHVYPDPLARFANPANPDRPPMPPDDPLVARLAPRPQGPHHAGVAWIEGDGYLQ